VTGISESNVHEIISDLNICKVFARWVPKTLTEENKNKRMTALLAKFAITKIKEKGHRKKTTSTAKNFVEYFTSLAKEHYHEGMFWEKYLNANSDYLEN
jgi:hypothetical protein